MANAYVRERFLLWHAIGLMMLRCEMGLLAAFSSYDLTSLDFSFLTPHGVSSSELSLAVRDQFDVQPIRLATWRDPRKRLEISFGLFVSDSAGDLGLIKEKIHQRDPFLDNAIYRGCLVTFRLKFCLMCGVILSSTI